MPSPSHPVERFSFSTALFGMLVLTLGMGLGRFLYTPMLPVMMAEGSFSFSQLSWIASGNYAGYLAGSLLFSFGAFHQPSRLRPFLLACPGERVVDPRNGMVAAIYSGVIDSRPGGCRQRRYADFWFDADYAAHAPSLCWQLCFLALALASHWAMNMFWQACILTSPRKRYGKAPGRFLA